LAAAAAFTATASFSSAALAASQHLGQRTLREGMTGHDVRVLQGYLTRAGFPTPIVGTFGPQTEANVIGFERRYHLKPNGIVNARFVKTIRAVVAASSTTGTTSTTTGTTSTTATTGATTPGSTANITAGDTGQTGGVGFGPGPNDGPVSNATLGADGLAVAPADAPAVIREVIAAGNKIAFKPYIYGGGHGSWTDAGYDCSGSVSFALHGGSLLSQTEDSTEFESYGSQGAGRWITIWANSGHVYMYVAGLRFDTSAQSSTGGSRWTTETRSTSGYDERHPTGWEGLTTEFLTSLTASGRA
jgi:cell wall-associated NlpC family hydrolase